MNQMGSPVPCLNQRLTRRREYLIKWTLGRVSTTSIVMTRPFSLNRGPDYPTYLRIGRVPRLRKVQYSRLGVSRGPDFPPSDGTRESVGYVEGSHHSTDQLEQRARLPHFHANRSSRRRLKSEGLSTRSVQRNPHSSADATRIHPPV